MAAFSDDSSSRTKAGPSPVQWLAHKDKIVQLYRKHQLKVVSERMTNDHGFIATKRMYDRKLKQWNVSKNLKAKDKDNIVAMLIQTGTWPNQSPPGARHRQIEIEGVTPHHVRKAVRHAKAEAYRTNSSPARQQSRSPQEATRAWPPTHLQLAPKTHDIESWIHVLQADGPTDESCATPHESSGYHTIDVPVTPTILDSPESISASTGLEHVNVDSLSTTPATRSQTSKHLVRGEAGFIFSPQASISHPSRTFNLEKMLKSITTYASVVTNTVSQQSTDSPTSSSPIGLWGELKNGIYLLKVNSPELAWPSLDKAMRMAPVVLSQSSSFDLNFLRELLLTLSPVNTRVNPVVRATLIQYISFLTHSYLKPGHPIATICHELQQDGGDREVSERALTRLRDALETNANIDAISSMMTGDQSAVIATRAMMFKIDCSIITLLRRDGELEGAANRAKILLDHYLWQTSGVLNEATTTGAELLEARLAARELSHVRMDQRGHEGYSEAIKLSLFVLTGRLENDLSYPQKPINLARSDIIEDGKSVHTLEDLAKIYAELDFLNQAVIWLQLAKSMADRIFGTEDTGTKHIADKLEDLQEEMRLVAESEMIVIGK